MTKKTPLPIADKGTPLTTEEDLRQVRDHRPPPSPLGGMGVAAMGGHPVSHARHERLPLGFTRHDGGKCPYQDKTRVELMILTAEGIGSSGITPAFAHDWNMAPDCIGGIVGYRLVDGDG